MDTGVGKKISNYSSLLSYHGCKRNSKFSLDEFIVGEILTRLPVKSLLRFKCVCKNWMVAISKKDRYFIDLHFDRSKSRDSCFILMTAHVDRPRKLRLWSAPFKEEGVVENPQKLISFPGEIYWILNIVNGLICFTGGRGDSFCVYNPSTRELTPCFRSVIRQPKEVKYNTAKYTRSQHGSAFGYDHVSREYKIITFWTRKRYHGADKIEDNKCEVLTVCGKQGEQNKRRWRRIDAVPPIRHYIGFICDVVYANGCIYWFQTYIRDTEPMLVKFIVGNETFKVTPLPSFIIDDINDKHCLNAIEVDGHFSVLVKKWAKNNNTQVNMYILYDDAQCSGDFCWKEETFLLPPFDWMPVRKDSILPIAGTNLFIIKCYDNWSFYVFDWKKKIMSNRKFEVPLSSGLAKKCPNQMYFYTYQENMLPLN